MKRDLFRPIIILVFLLCGVSSLTAQNIYTFAGSTVWGFYGDSGPAINAQLYNPTGVAIDAAGNIYIADSQNHRIRKITPAGIIGTFAGTGVAGFAGDSGLAINCKFYYPTDVAVDGAGNVYVADQYNNRIRKINTGGTITTVAGSGVQGFGGDSGLAVKAKLNFPRTIALDAAGNMYIADYYNSRIRKVATTGTITTFCGTGVYGYNGNFEPRLTAQMSFPHGIDVDAAGNVYFSDANNNYIRKIDLAGIVTIVAGTGNYGNGGNNGPAISADLNYPGGLAVSPSGIIYFAERNGNQVRKIENDTIRVAAGNGWGDYYGDGLLAPSAHLYRPWDVCVDKVTGDFYIADQSNQRIRKVTVSSGTISTVAGGGTGGYFGDNGPALSAEFNYLTGIATDGSNVYVADTYNNVIRKINSAGIVTTFAGNGTAGFSGDGGPATSAQLNNPYDVKLDAAGNVYIADKENDRIRVVGTTGTITTFAGTGVPGFFGDGGVAVNARLNNPWGIAVTPSGVVYISDYSNARIRKVSGGIITTIAGTGLGGYNGDDTTVATNARINGPKGIDVDAAGDVYFADFFNHRIRKIMTTGTITTVAGSGTWGYSGDGTPAKNATFKNPTSVTVDNTGQLYISDNSNHVVRLVNAAGTMTTFAASGIEGFAGDYGPATGARMRYPYACTKNAAGDVFITDSYNNRIREVCAGSCAVGVQEIKQVKNSVSLIVYPNPNNGEFTLKGEEDLSLNIINELGQSVRSLRLDQSNDFQVKLTNLNTGIYFITGNKGLVREKIVVIK